MPMTTVQLLHKTRKSINAHLDRGQGLGRPERPNWRGCELKDRYDSLREELTEVGGYSNPEWVAYCKEIGADPSHSGGDLFA